MFWPSLALVAAIGGFGYFAGRFPEEWQNLAVAVAATLVVLVLWVFPFLSWLGRHYTVTTRRIVLQSGLLIRSRQELLHSRGYDVTVRKSWVQSMFGSGDVIINTGLDRPIVLRDVPSANLVQSALHELMESSQNSVAARRQSQQSSPSDETTAWGAS